MFCQYCGKKIDEFADVCIGCGKLLKQEKKSNTQSKLFMALSIIVLVFSSIFFVFGAVSFFVGCDNDFFDVIVSDRSDIRVYMQTCFFVSFVI
jgi:predicted nucleic acid-binding Zn ribbon protein